jgi:hypothetical protein
MKNMLKSKENEVEANLFMCAYPDAFFTAENSSTRSTANATAFSENGKESNTNISILIPIHKNGVI